MEVTGEGNRAGSGSSRISFHTILIFGSSKCITEAGRLISSSCLFECYVFELLLAEQT